MSINLAKVVQIKTVSFTSIFLHECTLVYALTEQTFFIHMTIFNVSVNNRWFQPPDIWIFFNYITHSQWTLIYDALVELTSSCSASVAEFIEVERDFLVCVICSSCRVEPL